MGFLAKKGVKIQNFKKSKKVPLEILEIHVVSKFGPIPIKIATCRCVMNNKLQTSHTPYRKLYLQNSIKPSTTLNYSEYSPSGLVVTKLSMRFAQIKIILFKNLVQIYLLSEVWKKKFCFSSTRLSNSGNVKKNHGPDVARWTVKVWGSGLDFRGF